jgi:Immunity protein 22
MDTDTVHVFVARGRFRSLTEVHEFVDQTYTEDGEAIRSSFMTEVVLSEYEPMCIETVHSARPLPLAELLQGASFLEQWGSQIDGARVAESAVCVFSPNAVAHPERSSLEYVGAFAYSRMGRAIPDRLDPL